MNKKGQKIIVGMMVGVMALVMFTAFTKPLLDEVNNTINSSNLNCSNPNLSAEIKGTCVIADNGLFYFLSVVIAVGLAFVAGQKNILGIITTIFVFVATVALINPLKVLIINARSSGYLNCAATTITGAKLACIVLDLWLFYFVAVVLASAAAFITAKKIKIG